MSKSFFKQVIIVGMLSFFSLFFVISADAQSSRFDTLRQNANTQLNQLPSTDEQEIIGLAINILTMFMGAIMFALVVYGGLLWMTANGNGEKITKAKNIIVWSALGVAVMLVSYVLINYLINVLG